MFRIAKFIIYMASVAIGYGIGKSAARHLEPTEEKLKKTKDEDYYG